MIVRSVIQWYSRSSAFDERLDERFKHPIGDEALEDTVVEKS